MQELPEKFVSLHGASLPSSMLLKTHSGLEWNVKVVKGHGRIWLHKGWPDFEGALPLGVRTRAEFPIYPKLRFQSLDLRPINLRDTPFSASS